MRILIIEPHSTGHHANYVRWVVAAAMRKRWEVVLATTADALDHPALRSINSEFSHVGIHLIGDSVKFNDGTYGLLRLVRRELVYRRLFEAAAREVCAKMRVDAIVIPYADYCFYALAILGAPFALTPWCAISMRLAMPPAVRPGAFVGRWKWRVARRIVAEPFLSALFVINPSVQDAPAAWFPAKLRPRLRYLKDPAEHAVPGSRSASRAALGLNAESVNVLVFGSIDERKGADILLSALATANDLREFVVVLAGRQSAGCRRLMESRACARLQSEKRLIVLDRYLNEIERGEVFASADVVWVGYRDHKYMSGVLVLAGRAGLPVIGMKHGEIGRLIAAHGLGAVAAGNRDADVADALRSMRDAMVRRAIGERAQQVFGDHTVEAFGDSILAAFDPTTSHVSAPHQR
jgi:glycosyltransferase involved in cell wall biosynthesis